MAKELLISQTLKEVRVALMENGEILDFMIDRGSDTNHRVPLVGDIFLGKVARILPGMQSAFINIGYERAAFLYVGDAYIPTLEEQREISAKIKESLQNGADKRVGELIPDELSTFSEAIDMKFRPEIKIEDILKEGDEILVQIAKEPISTKGPRVTRHITLAGHSIVFMPFIEHVGVSRRIESEEERERLREVLEKMRTEGRGVIARTVAEGQSIKTLKNDYNMLVKIWKDVQKKMEKARAPCELYNDLTFIERILRDVTDEELDLVLVDNKTTLKQVEKFIDKFLPEFKGKVKLFIEDIPLFERYGVDLEIERALSSEVYLKSGGSIHIDQTEALVSIDVNTGKFVGKRNLEETILKTNLEAVKEIAYQLRLRNCGGILIIDFIDMDKEEHRSMVYNALLEALKKDRAKTNVLPISGLGLVEMTRKRTRDTLTRLLCTPCSYCEGTGRVKSVLSVCYEIIRELMKTMKKAKGSKITLYAHPEVCARLTGQDLDIIDNLEETYNKNLIIRSENNYHMEQYEIFAQEFNT
ncbi:MAG: Rne/Rng family ribonuclease [Bacteriovoracaceae bacterium]|nr:Rne/Rng family ribonuclease [Bacteriovoracaceae bacterium]